MPTVPTDTSTNPDSSTHQGSSTEPDGSTSPWLRSDLGQRSRRRVLERRFVAVYLTLLALLLLALVPPLINVNRFQHRIVTSISTTLGRPVHLDRVSLNVLPFPGFTLENFVVAEDPAFGTEPIIRANTVRVRLRIASLWRRKVEFSTISLDEPSLNLVHNAQGHWNFESILRQTSQISAAPTGQLRSGTQPRFPYIEATGARINVKSGIEKLPLALTEADLALWLPAPQQWNLRLRGRPSRTDTSASDTGVVTVEGTFGRAATFAETPLDLKMLWQHVPLGEASIVLLGRDIGVRGELIASFAAQGTAQDARVTSRIEVNGVRRATFVPAQPVNLDLECQANAAKLFHAFHGIQCIWPPQNAPASGLGQVVGDVQSIGSLASGTTVETTRLLALTGDIDDVYDPASASLAIGAPQLSAETLLDWLRVLSDRVPTDERATGVVTAKFLHEPAIRPTLSPPGRTNSGTGWTGDLLLQGASLVGGPLGKQPIKIGDLELHSSPLPGSIAVLTPATIALGGRETAVLDGRLDRSGYTLHLVGTVLPERLAALARAVPQLGDGVDAILPEAKGDSPLRLDATITRSWDGTQHWSRTLSSKPTPKTRRRSSR